MSAAHTFRRDLDGGWLTTTNGGLKVLCNSYDAMSTHRWQAQAMRRELAMLRATGRTRDEAVTNLLAIAAAEGK